eukprot:2374724-Karenia_brevis.AAC.1
MPTGGPATWYSCAGQRRLAIPGVKRTQKTPRPFVPTTRPFVPTLEAFVPTQRPFAPTQRPFAPPTLRKARHAN